MVPVFSLKNWIHLTLQFNYDVFYLLIYLLIYKPPDDGPHIQNM
jgi:hypothetical protein